MLLVLMMLISCDEAELKYNDSRYNKNNKLTQEKKNINNKSEMRT